MKTSLFSVFKSSVHLDMLRYPKNYHGRFIKLYRKQMGFRILFWTRLYGYLNNHCLFKPLAWLSGIVQFRMRTRFSIELPLSAELGPGLYLPHQQGVVINAKAVIGNNVYISQNVTIGKSIRGKSPGVPVVGNNVFIGPGAVILGGIRVGDFAAIGANTVVTQDVPSHAVIVGNPAKVISNEGSKGYC